MQLSSHKMNRWQTELETLSKKVATLLPKQLHITLTYIIVKRKTLESETLHNN